MKIISVLAAMAWLVCTGPGSAFAGQGASGSTTVTVTIAPEQLAALRGGPASGLSVTPEGAIIVPAATVVTDAPGDGNTIIRTIVTY